MNNELARFDYDFERKRISKTNSVDTTNYIYAGSQIVNETQNNANTASYTIGAGEIVRSEFAGGENNFHFTDALGSVTSLANGQGSLTSQNEYNAFGELSTVPNSSNSIGYTGQRLDSETGLMALGNGERYYSPQYARFIQQDSFAGVPSMPQSLNRFAYGLNNPNKHTDPSGNVVPLILWGIAAIVIAAVSTSTVERHAAHNLEGEEKGWANDDPRRSWGAALGDGTGMTKIVNAALGQDVYSGRDLGWKERAWQGTLGTIEVIGNATGLSGAVFKAGSLVINAARGGDEMLNLGRGAWSSIKNIEPAIADAKAVADAVRHPFQTAKAGWQSAKEIYQGAKSTVGNLFEGGAKQTGKRVWEFTKERLNPFNYKRDGANINFVEKETIGSYRELKNLHRSGELVEGAQANHLNQNAVYKSIIPEVEGASNVMRGNAFTEAGTPHYEFHRSLESFWDRFRRGGADFLQRPTNGQYGQAVETALRDAGIPSRQASRVANYAGEQRISYGLLENDLVPRIPRRINQTGGTVINNSSVGNRIIPPAAISSGLGDNQEQ